MARSADAVAWTTNTELAWFAGLFEGEGYTCLRPWRLEIDMTDRSVLEKALAFIPGSRLYGPYKKKEGCSDVWRWSLTRGDLLATLIPVLMPLMSERRAQKMQELLDVLKTRIGKGHGSHKRKTP